MIVIGMFLLASYLNWPQRIEDTSFGFIASLVASDTRSSKVALLAIDEESLKKLGSWPWSRRVIADGVSRLRSLKVQTIGLMLPLHEPQSPARLNEMYGEGRSSSPELRDSLRKWARRFDSDRSLSRAMSKAGNVIIPAEARYIGSGGLDLKWPDAELPIAQKFHRLIGTVRSVVYAPPASAAYDIRPPLKRFEKAAAEVGVLEPVGPRRSRSGVLLALESGGQAHPTFTSRVMAHALYSRDAKITPLKSKGVNLGGKVITTAPDFRYYPPPSSSKTGDSDIHLHSFSDLWNKKAHLKDLAGATVLVGVTVPGLIPGYGAPVRGGVAPVIKTARAVSSLLENSGFMRPPWFYAVQRALILSLILLLLLPARFHSRRLMVVGAVAALVLLNGGLVGLVTRQLWLPVALPALCVVTLTVAMFARRRVDLAVITVKQEAGELRLRFASNLHNQDNLDEAFDEYRLCPPNKALLERLYQLGLDYERRRKLDRAVQVYDFLRRLNPGYRDVRHRQARLEK
ncbi:MAG: CHASE2 domain-containing protein, partial [Gammaproteobacteria bacterium]|nr:CHASE2 domain-containing protein [Gammaproteobacteria bacterium]